MHCLPAADHQYWEVSPRESDLNIAWKGQNHDDRLQDLEKTGIRRIDKRLSRFMEKLEKIMDEEGTHGRSLDKLTLNKEMFSR